MLYVFYVDIGVMMTFDMGLAVESIENLKKHVEKKSRIPFDKQVLLISGGECLDSAKRVCSYAAGTDTNPFFLFCKSSTEHNITPNTSIHLTADIELKKLVQESILMPPSYTTVVKRAALSQKLQESAREQQRDCEKLVHDQHLQHQGWAAVVANLEDITLDFRKRSAIFEKHFRDYIKERDTYLTFLKHFNEDLNMLQKIPILSVLRETERQNLALEASQKSSQNLETPKTPSTSTNEENKTNSKEITLYEWLSSSDSYMEQLYEHCTIGLEKYDNRIIDDLCGEVAQILENADNNEMKEIVGLGDRLSKLEELMAGVKRLSQEQCEIAQILVKHQSSASNVKDQSIIQDLCDSHCHQLTVLGENHQKLLDIRGRCAKAKEELSSSLNHRLKWVSYIEDKILDIDQRIYFFHENLKRLRQHLEVLQQIHLAPAIYLSAVAEVVRRRSFSQSFLLWASELACELLTIHNEEISLRKDFQSQFEGHFLNTLFPGMSDLPPSFATQAPLIFDSQLPKITNEDIDRLKKELPDLAEHLNIPDSSAITNFFMIKSAAKNEAAKTSQDLKAIEDKIVQVVGDAEVAVEALPRLGEALERSGRHVVPQLKDLDKGCESETDTEEFEKVGQSPLELTFETKDLPKPGTADASTLTEDNLEMSKNENEKLRNYLVKLGTLARQAVLELRSELNDLKTQFNTEKSFLEHQVSSLSSSWENLSVDFENKEKEIVQKITNSHQSEISDFRRLAQVKVDEIKSLRTENLFLETKMRKVSEENVELCKKLDVNLTQSSAKISELEKRLQSLEIDKEKSLKDLALKMSREHKAEMESIKARFKLMTMERSPSDSSLEKIDRDFSSLTSLTKNESILLQMSENYEFEKEKAIKETIRLESEKWEQNLHAKVTELEKKFAEEKELILERVRDREKEINNLRNAEIKLKEDLNKTSQESNLELLKMVETLKNEKITLENELEKKKMEMSTSIASIATDGGAMKKSVTKCKSCERRPSKSGLNTETCKTGDSVLILWDETHESFKILQQDNKMLFFLHTDSLAKLGLEVTEGPPKKPNKIYCSGEVVDKDYCHARKSENRYKVTQGTKFYRVKVKPLPDTQTKSKLTKSNLQKMHMTQSQAVESISENVSDTEFHSLPSSPTNTSPFLSAFEREIPLNIVNENELVEEYQKSIENVEKRSQKESTSSENIDTSSER